MEIREKVKKEIEKIPDHQLKDVLNFLTDIRKGKTSKKKIHTFKLNGKFDNMNIRARAYE